MQRKKTTSAFSAGIGYTLGNVLVKGINFLTLPIFSRIMSPDEFGVFNVFLSYDAVLFVIVGLALHSSIRSANVKFPGQIDAYTSSMTLVYLLNTGVLALAVLLFGDPLGRLLGFGRAEMYLLILYSAGSAILTLYNNRISLEYSYKRYLAAALASSLGNILLSLVLILTVFRERQAFGRILGVTATAVVIMVVLLIGFYRRSRPRFNKSFWRFGLKYSLPIVPHGISQVLLGQFDRIMIRQMVSDAAAGIYSLAGNIKLVLTIISTSISTAWTTWFYEQMEKAHHADIRKRAIQLAGLFAILTVGLMALSPELIFLLGGSEYASGKYVAIPMVVDAFILFLYELVVAGEYYADKTLYVMLGTIGAAVLNVILNVVFIWQFGFIAAAYTTLFAYACYLVLHLLICRKAIGFCILPVKWLLAFGAVVVAMAAVDLLLIDQLVFRWLICAMVVIPMALLLLKSMGGWKAVLRRGEASEKKENVQ